MTGQAINGAETSQTMDRGLAVLNLLAEAAPSGRTVTELSRELGVGRPVVYRLLASLSRHNLVIRRADGRMVLGPGLTRLADRVTPGVAEIARPLLAELADRTGMTAHLTVADRDEAVAAAVVEPSAAVLHAGYRLGARHPLGAGAAGRAILGGRDGVADPVRSDGELQPGAHGIAVPVLGVPGLAASVGVVSLEPFVSEAIAPMVQSTAHALSKLLRE